MRLARHGLRQLGRIAALLAGIVATGAMSRAADEPSLLTLTLPDAVLSAAFSPDGRTLLTTSADGSARLLDAATGALVRAFKEVAASAAFSPDGERIAAASPDKAVRILEVANGREAAVLKGHTGDIMAVGFSQDGTRLVTASRDATARIWNAITGREMVALAGHKSEVRAAAFSPEGHRVVTVGADKTIRVWNAESGRAVGIIEYPQELPFATYSPDGTRIAVSTGGLEVRLWNAALSGLPHLTMRGHSALATHLAFSPDGARLVTASEDGTARVWDAGTGRILAVLSGHSAAVLSAAFSADGRRIVTSSRDKTVRVWGAPPVASQAGAAKMPAEVAGLWAAHVPPDAEPDLLQAACRTQPGMVHADGLVVVFGDPDDKHLPVPVQTLRCRPSFDCDIYEGTPKGTLAPLGAGKLTVTGRAGRFCFQDLCIDLARCPAIEWTAQEQASGFAAAWDERVRTVTGSDPLRSPH